MIHSIGDSHSWLTFAGIPEVESHHLGPVTMKRISRPEEDLLPTTVKGIVRGPDDILLFAFGEIDLRCWVDVRHRQHESGKASIMLIEWIEAYLNKVDLCGGDGGRIVVMSIPPPVTAEKAYNVDFPIRGTDAQRVEWTRLANDLLAEGCQKRGMVYLDLYTPFADERGMLPDHLSDSSVHLCCPDLVRQALVNAHLISKGEQK